MDLVGQADGGGVRRARADALEVVLLAGPPGPHLPVVVQLLLGDLNHEPGHVRPHGVAELLAAQPLAVLVHVLNRVVQVGGGHGRFAPARPAHNGGHGGKVGDDRDLDLLALGHLERRVAPDALPVGAVVPLGR
ncbi:hypothetical protein GGP45_000157 [Salinibacter ruber]|uniref:Uncharacterized protein n=1 Tax=Salinibacter ruber TaxID=146919 RepID=A0A9X2V4Q4_9BACT|nr:hypothetical protein [Salinibacter ruber]MCS4119839.1 hypothetical protein [Salinibacter ruber]